MDDKILIHQKCTKATTDVVIIGAGLSGLTAAAKLYKGRMFNVEVLEGRSRVGGRLSCACIDGMRFEEGATFIHGTEDNPLNELIREAKLKYLVSDGQYEERAWYLDPDLVEYPENVNGRLIKDIEKVLCDAYEGYECFPKDGSLEKFLESRKESLSHFAFVDKELRAITGSARNALIDLDIKQNLVDMLLNCFRRNCLLNECNFEGITDLTTCPIWSFEQFRDLAGEHCRFESKYSDVLQPLLEYIPSEALHLNCEVTQIEWNCKTCADVIGRSNQRSKPVVVQYIDEESGIREMYADHVIVTIPLGCLKANHANLFHPNLPTSKIDAINNAGFSHVEKLVLIYDKPFLDEKVKRVFLLFNIQNQILSDDWKENICDFEVLKEPNSQRIRLEAWLVGDDCKTVAALSNEEIKKSCAELLRKFIKNVNIPEPAHVHITKWSSDRFSLGSYSFPTKENEVDYISKLAQPVPCEAFLHPLQVLFAGEATESTFYSTVHGAFVSGEREAKRLIEHYYSSK